jgi:signal transduction histidine kinase/CheY-like chemotaxis protein
MPEPRFPVRAFRGSIRWRASLLTSGLVALVLTAFIGYAFRQVEADLLRAGRGRVETTATILSTQTAASTLQGLNRLQESAKDPAIREFIASASAAARARAIAQLQRMATGSTGGEALVEVWDATQSQRLLSATSPDGPGVLPAGTPPFVKGVSPLQARAGKLFTRVVVEVPREADAPQGSGPLGYVVLGRVVRPQSPSVITGMVGNSATILIGNPSGSVWTDLEKMAPAPAFDIASAGAHEFTNVSGAHMIGAAVPIANTPWTLVIEVARDPVVAPAWSLLRRLTGAGLVLLVLTTMAAAALGGQVTRPLADLTRAAETIAAGDYSSRVLTNRRDEVGQLGQAFNDMATRVERAHNALALRAADLSESRESAQRANRVKDQFLAVLSHELRTPLAAMLGWCRMLRDGTVPQAKTGHALEVIERNAVAQLHLVEDLLDVSRIVAGKFAVDLQVVEPSAIVHAAVESIQPVAAAKHVNLETHLNPQVGHVRGDPGRLQQAVWNLLSNAIKFTPAGGTVDISVARTGDAVEIVVRDNGEGISADVLPLVFDRFQQDDSAVTGRRKGLGLGLAIVRQVVELHGGSVSVESGGVGQGAAFGLRLPALAAADAAPVRREPSVVLRTDADPMPASVRGVHVLAVEDADDARDLLSQFLTAQGAVVTAVDGAGAALQWLDGHQPDVIISDIEMPDQDGLALIRRIREQASANGLSIPAIALTAYGSPEDRERSLLSGFQAHLVKPVELTELVTTISSLVNGGARHAGANA